MKKKLEYLKETSLFAQYQDIISKHKILDRVEEDVQMSRVFSIIVFTLSEIVHDVGLL